MTDHTPIRKISRLEVVETGARRRWTLAEKQRIVAESCAGPRLVSATARRYGLSASHLFTWRRLAQDGRLAEADEVTTFASAIIDDNGSPTSPKRIEAVGLHEPAPPLAAVVPSRIEIALVSGHRVIVDDGVDAAALARVLAVLERR